MALEQDLGELKASQGRGKTSCGEEEDAERRQDASVPKQHVSRSPATTRT